MATPKVKKSPGAGHKLKKGSPPLGARYPLDILLVEDNKVNQKVALRMLAHFGYTPKLAENGVEALRACARAHFDIIFMVRCTMHVHAVLFALPH